MNASSLVTRRYRAASEKWPPRRVVWQCRSARGILLVRYHLLRTRWLTVMLHRLAASDDDRALHDHPWAFVTVLLTSGYHEHTLQGRFWRRRFSVLSRPATWQHRLELVKPMWSLVFRGPTVREWGFIVDRVWVQWKTYGRALCD